MESQTEQAIKLLYCCISGYAGELSDRLSPGYEKLALDRGRGSLFLVYNAFDLFVVPTGTDEPGDWLTNVDARMHQLEEKRLAIHSGFKLAGAILWGATQVGIRRLSHNRRVFYTGHSLGGALAVLMAIEHSKNIGRVERVVTFGQPRTGNAAWAKAADGQLDIHRYRTAGDIVPHLPTAWRYRHTKKETTLKSGNASFGQWARGVAASMVVKMAMKQSTARAAIAAAITNAHSTGEYLVRLKELAK